MTALDLLDAAVEQIERRREATTDTREYIGLDVARDILLDLRHLAQAEPLTATHSRR